MQLSYASILFLKSDFLIFQDARYAKTLKSNNTVNGGSMLPIKENPDENCPIPNILISAAINGSAHNTLTTIPTIAPTATTSAKRNANDSRKRTDVKPRLL